MPLPVALAADHGGYQLKNHILQYLAGQGVETVDFGVNAAQSVDYPDYAAAACEAVTQGRCGAALLFCTTGAGMSMAANKLHGIRACCCSDAYTAKMTRLHNNANALCLGQGVVGQGLAEVLVDAFLAQPFSEGERHCRRIEKITELERRR